MPTFLSLTLMPPMKASLDKVKKPRHRHSAIQLAALNALYEETEHPSLAQRTSLAQSLGLETKSVNAFFQNRRASQKKQPRGSPYDAPQRAPSQSHPSSLVDDDYYYPPTEHQHFRSEDPHGRNQLSSPIDRRQFLFRTDELQRIYRINPYPTVEESRVIAQRIGMRYQTIVDWFRTQRNLYRRSLDDDYPTTATLESIPEASDRHSRILPILPPISTLPPPTSHPSLVGFDRAPRLSTAAVPEDQYYPAHNRTRSSSPRNATPYSSSSTALSLSARQRRGRPDSFQLNSLRRLLSKTPTPSIEERSALALEIGMDLGKVTNWFRNLRQSARKREKKHGRPGVSDDDFDYNEPVYLSSTSRSRSETPRMSSVERDADDVRGRRRRHAPMPSSDDEEDAQEAVTPSSSPSPEGSPSRRRLPDLEDKPTVMSSVPYEDALLLLSFHRRAGMF
ncbi:homeodomain transcription factor [Mycena olivaceomarginata]|nr:homeodomain transcription factor [Mycena olivaceomarginata]